MPGNPVRNPLTSVGGGVQSVEVSRSSNPLNPGGDWVLGMRKMRQGKSNPLANLNSAADEQHAEEALALPGMVEDVPSRPPSPTKKPDLEEILWNYFKKRAFVWNGIGLQVKGMIEAEAKGSQKAADDEAQATAQQLGTPVATTVAMKGGGFANEAIRPSAPRRGFVDIVPGEAEQTALKECSTSLTPLLGEVLGYELPKFLMTDLVLQVPGLKQLTTVAKMAWQGYKLVKTKFFDMKTVKEAQAVFEKIEVSKLVADGLLKVLKKSFNDRLFTLGTLAVDLVTSMVDMSGILSTLEGCLSSAARLIYKLVQLWGAHQMMTYVNYVLSQEKRPKAFNLDLFKRFPLLACYATDVVDFGVWDFIGYTQEEFNQEMEKKDRATKFMYKYELWQNLVKIANETKADAQVVLAGEVIDGYRQVPDYIKNTTAGKVGRFALKIPSHVVEGWQHFKEGVVTAGETIHDTAIKAKGGIKKGFIKAAAKLQGLFKGNDDVQVWQPV